MCDLVKIQKKNCKSKKQKNIGAFENSHIRFAVTESTHNRSSFCQRNHRKFGWWFDTVNTNCRNCFKNAFEIGKLPSLTEKIQMHFILSTIFISRKIDIK